MKKSKIFRIIGAMLLFITLVFSITNAILHWSQSISFDTFMNNLIIVILLTIIASATLFVSGFYYYKREQLIVTD